MYEEAKNCGAGGEGVSSRAHGIPHGTGNDQLHGSRTVLRMKNCKNEKVKRGGWQRGCRPSLGGGERGSVNNTIVAY